MEFDFSLASYIDLQYILKRHTPFCGGVPQLKVIAHMKLLSEGDLMAMRIRARYAVEPVEMTIQGTFWWKIQKEFNTKLVARVEPQMLVFKSGRNTFCVEESGMSSCAIHEPETAKSDKQEVFRLIEAGVFAKGVALYQKLCHMNGAERKEF